MNRFFNKLSFAVQDTGRHYRQAKKHEQAAWEAFRDSDGAFSTHYTAAHNATMVAERKYGHAIRALNGYSRTGRRAIQARRTRRAGR